jgi:hypothetical protein
MRNAWVGAAAAIALLAFHPAACAPKLTDALAFDRKMWDAGPVAGKEDFRRHRIADGLVASRQLIGNTRGQIIELLGTPANSGRQDVLEYVLGEPRNSYFPVNPEVLTIEFTADGRASRAYTRST